MAGFTHLGRERHKNIFKNFVVIFFVVASGCLVVSNTSSADQEVVINEVAWMGTASSSSEEWLEFFNTGTTSVDISGWSIYGADTKECINISDADGTSTTEISPEGYAVYGNSEKATEEVDVWDATIGLNNSDPGDIELFSEPGCPSTTSPVDSIENGEEWLAGDNDNHHTMARNEQGEWRNSADLGGTPGKANAVVSTTSETEDTDTAKEGSSSDGSNSSTENTGSSGSSDSAGTSASNNKDQTQNQGLVVINEILPNPEGSDRRQEFIELYNPGEETAYLEGWRIKNRRGKVFEFGRYQALHDLDPVLAPGEFLTVPRPSSGVVLNNNRESLQLISPAGKTEQRIEYDRAPAGFSYCNPNHLNLEEITTSTSVFLRHSLHPSDWAWSKRVTPGYHNQIHRINLSPRVNFSFPREIKIGQPVLFDSSDTVDPNGDPLSFKWNFGDGVEVETPMPYHTFLEPGKYSVTLKVEDGHTVSERTREVTVKAENGAGGPSQKDTPEKKDTPPSKKSTSSSEKFSRSQDDPSSPASKQEKPTTDSNPFFSLENIKQVPEGDPVLTKGTVAVRPGVLGSQYFYIVGSPGVQVYNYHKDFPELVRGDRVQVKGEISVSRQEKRINTSEAEDVRVLSSGEPPSPQQVECESIPRQVGSLVTARGEITSVETNKFYIDDQKDEALVYIQEEVDLSSQDISSGKRARVTGLVNRYDSQTRILPRDEQDVSIIASSSSASSGRVLGASVGENSDNKGKLVLSSPGEEKQHLPYLTEIVLGGVIIILLVVIKFYRVKDPDQRA